MSSYWDSADIQCPFFSRVESRRIKCEGPFQSTVLSIWFDTNKERNEVFRKYCCCTNYLRCPVYLAALEKYNQ